METRNVHAITPIPSSLQATPSTHLTVGTMPAISKIPQIRDPEWLKLEICREFQRGACKRSSDECRFAHPTKNIQVGTDGKVTACYDAFKGKCNRESCKYLHPSLQQKQLLEVNGKQALMQNRQMLQQMVPIQPTAIPGAAALTQGGLVGYEQIAAGNLQPLASTLPLSQLYSPAIAAAPAASAYSVLQPPADLTAFSPPVLNYYPLAVPPTQVAAMLPAAGNARVDKLEVCRDYQRGNCTRGETECRYGHPPDRSMIDATDNTVTVCMDYIKGRCTREKCKYFHPPAHLQAKIRAAQNPNTSFLNSLAPTAIGSPQPTVMMTNGAVVGQPPLKRHALDGAVISSGGNGIGSASSLTSSAPSQPSPLTALYGYTGASVPGMNTVHHQNLPAAPAYYQQTLPMLHLQYGAATGALSAAPGQAAPLAAFNLPTTSSCTVNGNATSYALLNGQSQLASDASSKSGQLVTTNPAHGLGTLTVCRDFQSGKCTRPFCRFVHIREDYVEVRDDKVTVCRNALLGKCHRPQCKFYHLPSANVANSFSSNSLDLSLGEAPAPPNAASLNPSGLIQVMSNGSLSAVPQMYPHAIADGAGL